MHMDRSKSLKSPIVKKVHLAKYFPNFEKCEQILAKNVILQLKSTRFLKVVKQTQLKVSLIRAYTHSLCFSCFFYIKGLAPPSLHTSVAIPLLLSQGLYCYIIYFLAMFFSVKMLIHQLQKHSFVTPIWGKNHLKNVKLPPISLLPITAKFLKVFT